MLGQQLSRRQAERGSCGCGSPSSCSEVGPRLCPGLPHPSSGERRGAEKSKEDPRDQLSGSQGKVGGGLLSRAAFKGASVLRNKQTNKTQECVSFIPNKQTNKTRVPLDKSP